MAALAQENPNHPQIIVEEAWVKASLRSDWDTVTTRCPENTSREF